MGSGYNSSGTSTEFRRNSPMQLIYFQTSFRSSGNIKWGVSKLKIDKKAKASVSKYLIYGAVVAVLLSVAGWLGRDIWLASTQWLLIAAVLTLFGIYLRLG